MDPITEKTQLLEEIENAGNRGPSPESIRKYLKLVREQRTRESESVARWGSLLLRRHRKLLREEELWLVHEQVALAAMDCQATRCAASCVNAVCREFDDKSVRAKRLKGMYFEATGNLDRAENIYNDILRDNPSNEMVLKRKVAIHKTRGDLVGASQALKTYLDSYMMDRDAWDELADLYTKMQLYKQAAFCYEELMMLASNNLTYYLRYADVLYTIGGPHNFRMALTYFCQALEMSGGKSVRALYGVCSCLSHLRGAKGAQDPNDRRLQDLASGALRKVYAEFSPQKLAHVNAVLKAQGLVEK